MQQENVHLNKKFIIGVPLRTSNETFNKDIPPLWANFFMQALADKIPNKLNNSLLAVYTDYEGDYTKPFTYIIAAEVAHLNLIPEGMVGLAIEPANYAVFNAIGDFPASLINTWHSIWKSDLNRTYITDFEIYKEDFNPYAQPEIEIYISVNQ